jgi:hypothetical protein
MHEIYKQQFSRLNVHGATYLFYGWLLPAGCIEGHAAALPFLCARASIAHAHICFH